MPAKAKIRVYRLSQTDVTDQITEGINVLLKLQHGKAFRLDESYLRHHIQRQTIVAIAIQGKKVVGVGTVVNIDCLTHWYAKVHNFVIQKDQDLMTIGEQIAKVLTESVDFNLAYIDGPQWVQDPKMYGIFRKLGYSEEALPRLRLKLKNR